MEKELLSPNQVKLFLNSFGLLKKSIYIEGERVLLFSRVILCIRTNESVYDMANPFEESNKISALKILTL